MKRILVEEDLTFKLILKKKVEE